MIYGRNIILARCQVAIKNKNRFWDICFSLFKVMRYNYCMQKVLKLFMFMRKCQGIYLDYFLF